MCTLQVAFAAELRRMWIDFKFCTWPLLVVHEILLMHALKDVFIRYIDFLTTDVDKWIFISMPGYN